MEKEKKEKLDVKKSSVILATMLAVSGASMLNPMEVKASEIASEDLDEIKSVVTPDGNGDNVTPDGNGDDVTPDGNGDNVTPDENGDDVTPDENGDDENSNKNGVNLDVPNETLVVGAPVENETAAGDELLTNGGFENGDLTSFDVTPASGKESDVTSEVVDWGKQNGTYGLCVKDTSTWSSENQGSNVKVTQTISHLDAGEYQLKVSVMGNGSDSFAFIDQGNVDTNWNSTASTWGTWQTFTHSFTLTEGVDDATFGINAWIYSGGNSFCIDDFSLTKVGNSSGDVTPVEGKVNVTRVEDLSEDFIKGVDISSAISLFDSGVVYYDYEGNEINNVNSFCAFLKDQGVTHIRIRVWNDPYDANGNGYGGGNNDVAKAKIFADAARSAGLKMMVDFHCSDFWTDPAKQQAPKAWSSFTLEEKEAALQAYMTASLNTIDPTKDVVTMVQVGNETTTGFVGETNKTNMCALFKSGIAGVKAYNSNVKTVIHLTNPEKGNMTSWAATLNTNNVDYDVLATSYYPYWHGTYANLQSQLETVKQTYGKDVMVAETSYAYTLEDTDGHADTVRTGNNDTGFTEVKPFSVQGQVTSIRDVIDTVNKAGGIGVFYWEPAWLTVGDTTDLEGAEYDAKVAENKAKWESYGSGWASSYSSEYDAEDAGKWYGGAAVDNEAMFYADGRPTQGWKVWKYVYTGAVSNATEVDAIENREMSIETGSTLSMPSTVKISYNTGDVEESVTWNAADLAKVDLTKVGTYVVKGTVHFSKTVDGGSYDGKTSATAKMTITVKYPNLLDQDTAGIENGKASSFSVSSISIQSTNSSDTFDGSNAIHWWDEAARTDSVTLDDVITLEAGEYAFAMTSQGASGDKVKVQILDENDQVLFTGDRVELDGWKNWKTPCVSFTLSKKTKVKLQFVVEMKAGGWGTADSLYLYQTKKADGTDSKKDEVVKIVDIIQNEDDVTGKSFLSTESTTTTSTNTCYVPTKQDVINSIMSNKKVLPKYTKIVENQWEDDFETNVLNEVDGVEIVMEADAAETSSELATKDNAPDQEIIEATSQTDDKEQCTKNSNEKKEKAMRFVVGILGGTAGLAAVGGIGYFVFAKFFLFFH